MGGGRGQEVWGHPLEKTAQYNHTSERRLKPPFCPWRVEVGDLGTAARTLFLHVFEIADESKEKPTAVRLISPAGIEIGGKWKLRSTPKGLSAAKSAASL